jgi:hypothetical protein
LLDLLLVEIRQGILSSDPRRLICAAPFEMPWLEAACAVALEDEGFSSRAAWWLAREASVAEIVESVP